MTGAAVLSSVDNDWTDGDEDDVDGREDLYKKQRIQKYFINSNLKNL